MLGIWQAVRLDDVKKAGRTKPLVIECRPAGSSTAQASRLLLVKALGLPEVRVGSLLNELLGNLLARELGIETPEPFLVEISPEFVAAVLPVLVPDSLTLEPGLGVGCEYRQGGYTSLGPGATLTSEERQQAARIYAFDLLVQNPDRRPHNPNCMQKSGRLVAYDFEMAFSFLLVVGGQEEQRTRRTSIRKQNTCSITFSVISSPTGSPFSPPSPGSRTSE